ncbi:MAG TPA: hypothetical protein VE994_18790, partial [Terriglobales bacterium]|nr:hypothetical protein [Terriglobales bacterium]
NLVPQFPNLGAPVRNPNLNLAPQLGIAWDPTNNGKTVIRAGIGLFYENTIWNNVLFDRPTRIPQGAFLQTPTICSGVGAAGPAISIPGGTLNVPPNTCATAKGQPITIGAAASSIVALEQQFQALSPFTVAPNPSYIPTVLSEGLGLAPAQNIPLTFAPNFKTPRSVQMNIGFQHEIRPGLVFTADYMRNVTTHFLLGVDENHVGDARFFNMAGALQAIGAAVSGVPGCGGFGVVTPGTAQSAVNCYLANVNTGPNVITGAAAHAPTMSDFVAAGLTSTNDLGVTGCPKAGCAFPGINKAVSNLEVLEPVGRSVYNGLQMKLAQNIKSPFRGVKALNMQIAYSLSRFVNPGGSNPTSPPSNYASNADQDFIVGAPDYNNPNRYMGPSLLDRTHQLSFGGIVDLPASFRVGIISHFYSPLALPVVVPNSGNPGGEIFYTDFTGDGTTQDYMPGTKNGSFGRNFGVSGLNAAINNYNSTIAGNPTPAGMVLVNNGLFTTAQMKALGAVAPTVPTVPPGQVPLDWLRAFDLRFSWAHTFRERFTVEPSVGIYNAFNFANFDLPPNLLSPYLTGSAGSINGTTYNDQANVRVGAGTGVFGLGAPRVWEFGMKLSF